ncbi:MAG: SUMF1/EgtB/PvdO family nonheme iron enzyme [Kiritimatiellae bacterium]|nr:SUMF1/EgtB/PvdO family nonheme iron enzyme [Kiritimatiellia bacterium]
MKKSVLFTVVIGSYICIAATPTITGVTAQQRYPWNGKVDISYTVTGDIAAEAKQVGGFAWLKVSAVDLDANETYVATQQFGDAALAAGRHTIVWDMEAEGLAFKSTNVVFKVAGETAKYCVVDLSSGANAMSYPVTYMAEPPSGGFNVNEYKTTKLVLTYIKAGTFKMQGSTNVTLTKPFFCGLFEVTQKQYSLVMGATPSNFSGDTLPVEMVSYNTIRGSSNGAKWPSSSAVDASSFMGKLRARTGLDFDLPTEAQWEYACRAGTTTTYYWGNSINGNYAWYADNSSSKTHPVGSKTANTWGLYDMSGNVCEWCLDWYGSSLLYGTDPKGPSSGTARLRRGGSWNLDSSYCVSSSRANYDPSIVRNFVGFRVVWTLAN